MPCTASSPITVFRACRPALRRRPHPPGSSAASPQPMPAIGNWDSAYAEVGVRTGNRQQQAEAIRLLTAAPQDAEVHGSVWATCRSAPDLRTGRSQLYRSALRQDPNSVVALVNLGRLYGSQGFLDQAITLWREALKRNPCLAEAGANLQIALRAKNDTAGAEARPPRPILPAPRRIATRRLSQALLEAFSPAGQNCSGPPPLRHPEFSASTGSSLRAEWFLLQENLR